MSINAVPKTPWASLISRYRQVFGAAWAMRQELAGPKLLRDEAAFLPAALSLAATPVHPAPRRVAYVVCGLFTVALLWACLGKVDIVAVASGRVVVSDGTKLVQPLETSVVKAIHVRDGDRVKAGQLLIELDATLVEADQRRVQQERTAAVSDELRARALLDALDSGRSPQWPADPAVSADDRVLAQAQMLSEWADIQGKLAQLQAEVARFAAQGRTVALQIDKLETTLPLARQREDDFRTLSAQGFVAGHAGQDRTRERIELEKDLATARAQSQESLASQHEASQRLAAQRAVIIRQLRELRTSAQLRRHQMESENVKASEKSRLTRLVAPVDGTVQQLSVHTPGGVVTPAQALAVVVPDRAEVTAEVILENKDIGFVREDQAVEVKLEIFPYTRYGTIHAVVTRVAADAVMSEASAGMSPESTRSADSARSSAGVARFPATLRLARHDINVDGKKVRLTPGMNLTAEIKTGKRRVIDYLLSPVREHLDESLEER